MALKTFKRYENKYLLGEEQYHAVRALLPQYMRADTYNQDSEFYSIYNIYYDTPQNDIIRNSLSKPYFKEKLRLRSYFIPTSQDDKVYLELKKKIGGIVSKRRAKMTLGQATRFVELGIVPTTKDTLNSQVVDEIAVFLNSHIVAPSTFIGYDRRAFFGLADKEFRLTFDNNIMTRRNNVALEDGAFGTPLLQNAQYLMEVKISGAIPLWLAHVFSKQKIYSTSFSKYGTEYKKYCAVYGFIPNLVTPSYPYSVIVQSEFAPYQIEGSRSYA